MYKFTDVFSIVLKLLFYTICLTDNLICEQKPQGYREASHMGIWEKHAWQSTQILRRKPPQN